MRRNVRAGMERTTGFSLPLFSDDELEEIHGATLEILEHTGVFVESEEALAVFEEGGAKINRETKIVKLPPYLVEDAIRTAPSKLFLAGRDPKNDIILEGGRVGFTTFGEGVKVRDIETGEIKAPTKEDVGNAAKLADAMEMVDIYERAVGAHEVPQVVGQLHNAEATFNNTSKHVTMGPFDGYQLEKIVEMAAEISGGMDKLQERPLVTFITCPVSPLKLVQDTCEVIMGSAKTGMAVNILSMAMSGGSSPVTLAGTLVNHNAEVLAGVTLSQLTQKGAKVIYGSSTTAMDLRLASASVGSPECAMISAAVARLARYYMLPSFVAGS
ncbi:trimethylamine:corrinoid methyltransferase [Desulforhopalus singaporensis]|uniref:Trimethylamine:corrinoid methyltransferase n=1 Tax=Desulforhopalus singaporensis TaxID=91360 RepID=A0A1H0LIR2_9BACT|nr:trimethylamine:corrinoid methyltransferase [Desulforhopalus singaporensis]